MSYIKIKSWTTLRWNPRRRRLSDREKGLSETTARRVAVELTEHDALAAHLSIDLNIDQDDVVSPWHAAAAPAAALTIGAILPMAATLVPPAY